MITYTYNITDGNGGSVSQTATITITGADETNTAPNLLFSLKSGTTLDGVAVANEDIVEFDGSTFNLLFDGSDLGLAGVTIDAFDVISETEILLSFTNPINIAGFGNVDDSDIVKFNATSLGDNTTGTFEKFFDGSDVGLSLSGEDIDGVTLREDGTLLFSTSGAYNA